MSGWVGEWGAGSFERNEENCMNNGVQFSISFSGDTVQVSWNRTKQSDLIAREGMNRDLSMAVTASSRVPHQKNRRTEFGCLKSCADIQVVLLCFTKDM